MPKFEDGSYSSLPGIALIAKVLAGRCKIHYTRVAAGKGTLPEGITPKMLMEPPEYVMDAKISSVTNPVDGECQVSVQINSDYVESGFYCTWLILYAEDPDEGEVPFTALCLENGPEWIRPASSIVGKLAHFDIIAAVGDVDNVSATIDPDALVTLESVQQLIREHDSNAAAHQDIRQAIRALQAASDGGAKVSVVDITIPTEGWTDDGAGRYPYHVDIPVDGVTTQIIPRLTILSEGEDIAITCGLCPRVQTLDGVLRVSAAALPDAEIPASLTLQGSGGNLSGGSGGGNYVLPVATAHTLGGVKVGQGMTAAADGTISVDNSAALKDAVASDSSTNALLDEIFGNDDI